MKQRRRAFSAKEKVGMLREHLLEGKAVSSICEARQIQVSQFYTWQRQLFEGGEHAFLRDRNDSVREHKLEQKVATLEARLARKDQVIAEVTQEYVQLKKELGES